MINRRSTLKSMALGAVSTLAIAAVGISSAQAENKELKIGFVGVTSGPAAAWGTSNVRDGPPTITRSAFKGARSRQRQPPQRLR